MDLRFSAEDEAFRKEVRDYLDDLLSGEFAACGAAAAPATSTSFVDERMAWERHLGADGWTCVGWPTEHGGRGLSAAPAGRSSTRSTPGPAAPAASATSARRCSARPSSTSARPSSSSASCPASSPAPSCGARATASPTPAPTWPTSRPAPRLDGDEWVINGQKVWTSLAQWATGASCSPAPTPTPRATRASRTCWCRWTSPASRSGRSARSPAPPSSTRCSSRRPHRRRPRRRRRRRRVEGGHGHARLRAGRVDARPAVRLPARARRDPRRGRGERPPSTTRSSASGSLAHLEPAPDHALEHPAGHVDRAPTRRAAGAR